MSKIKPLQYGVDDVDVTNKDVCFQGFFQVQKYTLRHKKFDGSWSKPMTREVFERGDAVMVIPYDPIRDELVFNEQFRPGAMRTQDCPWLLEFVAGMFGPNESPVAVAIREAKEEANLTLDERTIEPVMKYLSSPGGTSEQIHIYVAKIDASLAGGVHGLDVEEEDICTHIISREMALDLLELGKINNAATIIGLQWLAMHYQSLQQKWV